jgi:hypothetical protein
VAVDEWRRRQNALRPVEIALRRSRHCRSARSQQK